MRRCSLPAREAEIAGRTVDVSIVVACYNEEPVLVENVGEIMEVLDRTTYKYEIIIVDDGSSDATLSIVKGLAEEHSCISYLVHLFNTGRGMTVADGFRMARAPVVGFIDIDLQTPARYIPSLIREVEAGADGAIARRIYKLAPAAVGRWILSKGYMTLSSLVLGLKRRDTETGCKFFHREAILPILDEVEDTHWFWDTEVMSLAARDGLDVVEVPTLFIRDVSDRSSVKIVRDVIHYLGSLLRLRQRLGRYQSAPIPMGESPAARKTDHRAA